MAEFRYIPPPPVQMNKDDLLKNIRESRDVIIDEDDPTKVLAVRYQSNGFVAQYFHNYIRNREFLNLVYNKFYESGRTSADPSYIMGILHNNTNTHTGKVDIDNVYNVVEREKGLSNLAKYLPPIVRFPPIELIIPYHPLGMPVEEWIKSWGIGLLNHIIPPRFYEIVFDNYLDPPTLLLYFIYHIIADMLMSNRPLGHIEVERIVITPEFYIARSASQFGLHQDCEFAFTTENVKNYTNKLDALSLMYLHTNKHDILRSATISQVPPGGLLPFGIHPSPHHSLSRKPSVDDVITLNGVTLAVGWGSSVYFKDPPVLHTSPLPGLPKIERNTRIPFCYDRYDLNEIPSEIIRNMNPSEIHRIETSFPTARSFVRLHYVNLDYDPILTHIGKPQLSKSYLMSTSTLAILIDELESRDPRNVLPLSTYLFGLKSQITNDRVYRHTIMEARLYRGFGRRRKPKSIKKRLNKKSKSIKKRVNKKSKSIKRRG